MRHLAAVMNSLLYPVYPISMEGRPVPRFRHFLRISAGLRLALAWGASCAPMLARNRKPKKQLRLRHGSVWYACDCRLATGAA